MVGIVFRLDWQLFQTGFVMLARVDLEQLRGDLGRGRCLALDEARQGLHAEARPLRLRNTDPLLRLLRATFSPFTVRGLVNLFFDLKEKFLALRLTAVSACLCSLTFQHLGGLLVEEAARLGLHRLE